MSYLGPERRRSLHDGSLEHSESAEARLKETQEVAHLGSWELDIKNRDDLSDNDLRWSDEVYRIFGFHPGEVDVNNELFFERTHPDDRDMVRRAMTQALHELGPYDIQHRIIRPDGTERVVHERAKFFRDHSGVPYRAIGTVQDITEFVQAQRRLAEMNENLERLVEVRTRKLYESEQELARAQKMEAVGRLAGGVAHDFNNILTGILGMAEDLVQTFDPKDPRRQDAKDIINAANRAFGLTKQLLAFGRRKVIQPKVLEINSIVQEYKNLFERLLGEDIKLVLDLKAEQKISVDPGSLGQVILNLAINARDAMPAGGTLTLRTQDTVLEAHHPERRLKARPGFYVMLEVADTGHGMSREVLARLFEPFFTTKEPGRGTGLGLATVYGIVEQAGGDIRVQSEPGGGSSFKIYFPVIQKAAEETRPWTPPVVEEVGKESVLVVEDDPIVRRLVVRKLGRLGYQVIQAENGQEALKKVESHLGHVDLVLTDVVMPEMNGRELVERLHQDYPRIKTLYMSGYPDDVIARHGVLEEDIQFIEKYDIASRLPQKVREVLEN